MKIDFNFPYFSKEEKLAKLGLFFNKDQEKSYSFKSDLQSNHCSCARHWGEKQNSDSAMVEFIV